jgi:hypothetical protein
MSLQDQYTDTLRQSQEAWSGAIETWTNGVQKAFGSAPVPPFGGSLFGSTPFTLTDPAATVDQLFDFAEKVLEVQREFVKNLTSATVSVGQAVRHQAESAGQAVRNQAESTGQLIREHNDIAARAASDALAKAATDKYGDMTKADLQDELARRDLPKTGNVEELRTRLVEDDQK